MTRRLSARGVSIILLTSSGWDHATNMRESTDFRAMTTDTPIAGLTADLNRCHLRRDPLVVREDEFGRQPNPDNNGGRSHVNRGFSM